MSGATAAGLPAERPTAGVRTRDVLIPVDRLEWDYSRTMGQIRQLTDDHVEEIRRSLAVAPPKVPVHVTVVPADALGVFCRLSTAAQGVPQVKHRLLWEA